MGHCTPKNIFIFFSHSRKFNSPVVNENILTSYQKMYHFVILE